MALSLAGAPERPKEQSHQAQHREGRNKDEYGAHGFGDSKFHNRVRCSFNSASRWFTWGIKFAYNGAGSSEGAGTLSASGSRSAQVQTSNAATNASMEAWFHSIP